VIALALLTCPADAGTERLKGTPGVGTAGETLGVFVADPGFEGGTPNAFWTEASTNFGTPICDAGSCGTGGGTGPHGGTFWVWFGGISVFEEGSVSQTVTLPAGVSASLTFYLEMPSCSTLVGDFLEVTVDGTQVFAVDGTDANCGTVGYLQQTVDVSSYLGTTFTLEFHSIVSGGGAATMNFFVDDVDIDVVIPVELQSLSVE
jgi:hypothetical protein